jgi:hypothetical protein
MPIRQLSVGERELGRSSNSTPVTVVEQFFASLKPSFPSPPSAVKLRYWVAAPQGQRDAPDLLSFVFFEAVRRSFSTVTLIRSQKMYVAQAFLVDLPPARSESACLLYG